MTKYIVKTGSSLFLLALVTTISFAQDEARETHTTKSDDVIIIKPKVNVDTKLTIEIKGDVITINGKPMAEYKSDDVNISRRKQVMVEDRRRMNDLDELQEELAFNQKALGDLDARIAIAPRSRFKNNDVRVFGYGQNGKLNLAMSPDLNSNRAFLGVGSEKTDDGVKIVSVSAASAAEKAGLKEGDIITKINDSKIESPEDLTKAVGGFNPGEKITITYKRDKKEQKATAVLTKRKMSSIAFAPQVLDHLKGFDLNDNFNYNFAFPGKPRLGLRAQETEEGRGLKVLDVDDESTAAKAGIKEGDIITSVDGKEVNDIDALRDLSGPAIEKGSFTVQVTRDGKKQDIAVKIPKKLKTTSL
jgi:serine protease Do